MLKRATWLIFFWGWVVALMGQPAQPTQGELRLPPKPKAWSSCTDDCGLLERSDLQEIERLLVEYYKIHSQRTYLLISDSTLGLPLGDFGRRVLDEWERHNFRDKDAVLLVISPSQRACAAVWDGKYWGVLAEKDFIYFSEKYLRSAESREELSAAVPKVSKAILWHMGHRSRANAMLGPQRRPISALVFLACVSIMLGMIALNRYWQQNYLSWREVVLVFWYLLFDLVVFSLAGILLAFLILYIGGWVAMGLLFFWGCMLIHRISEAGPDTKNIWELLAMLLGDWGLTRMSITIAILWMNLGTWAYVLGLLGLIILHFPYYLFAEACMRERQREAQIKNNTYRHDHWLKFFWLSVFLVLPAAVFFAKDFEFWFVSGIEYLFDSQVIVQINPSNWTVLALLPVIWFFRHLSATIYKEMLTYEDTLNSDQEKMTTFRRLKLWSGQLVSRPDIDRLRDQINDIAHDAKHHRLWQGRVKQETWLWVFYVIDVVTFMTLIARAPHCSRMEPLLAQAVDESIKFLDDFRAHAEKEQEMPTQYGPFMSFIQSIENLKGTQFIVEGFISPDNYEMNFEYYPYALPFFNPRPAPPQPIQTLLHWLKYWHISSCIWHDDPMNFSESDTIGCWRHIFHTQLFADEQGDMPDDARAQLQKVLIEELQFRLEAINYPKIQADSTAEREALLDQLYLAYLDMPKPAHISFF